MRANIHTKNLFNPISLTILVVLLGLFSVLFYLALINHFVFAGLIILAILISV